MTKDVAMMVSLWLDTHVLWRMVILGPVVLLWLAVIVTEGQVLRWIVDDWG